MHNYSPLVETYIQNRSREATRTGSCWRQVFPRSRQFRQGRNPVPLNDTGSKGRNTFGSVCNFFSFAMQFLPDGFLEMIFY